MQGEWFKLLVDGVENGEWVVVAVTLFVAALSSLYSIVRYTFNHRNMKVASIEAAWKSGYLDGESQEALRRQASVEHFQLATGIRLEKGPREALMKIYNRSPGRVSFVHFKRAARFVRYTMGSLEIHISCLDRFFLWFGLYVGGGLIVLGAPLILLFIASTKDPLSDILGSIYIVVSASVLLLQALPILSADRVKKEMACQAVHDLEESS